MTLGKVFPMLGLSLSISKMGLKLPLAMICLTDEERDRQRGSMTGLRSHNSSSNRTGRRSLTRTYSSPCAQVLTERAGRFSYLDSFPQLGFKPLRAEPHLVPASPCSSRSGNRQVLNEGLVNEKQSSCSRPRREMAAKPGFPPGPLVPLEPPGARI